MTLDEARALMREIVAEKGGNYVYPGTGDPDVMASCQYAWYERDVDPTNALDATATAPACIAGHFFHRAGVPLEKLFPYEGQNAGYVAVKLLGMDAESPIAAALQDAQLAQDAGQPWATALRDFNRALDSAEAGK